MAAQSAIETVFEALDLAVECGGDIDHHTYVDARQKLRALVDSVIKYDQTLTNEERSPDADDYNELLALLQFDLNQKAKS